MNQDFGNSVTASRMTGFTIGMMTNVMASMTATPYATPAAHAGRHVMSFGKRSVNRTPNAADMSVCTTNPYKMTPSPLTGAEPKKVAPISSNDDISPTPCQMEVSTAQKDMATPAVMPATAPTMTVSRVVDAGWIMSSLVSTPL